MFTWSHPDFSGSLSNSWQVSICQTPRPGIWHLCKTVCNKTHLCFGHKGPATEKEHLQDWSLLHHLRAISTQQSKNWRWLTSPQPHNLYLLRLPLMQRDLSRGSLSRAQTSSMVPTSLPQRSPFQLLLWHLQVLFLIPVSHTVRLRSLLRSEQGGQDKPLQLATRNL